MTSNSIEFGTLAVTHTHTRSSSSELDSVTFRRGYNNTSSFTF